MRTLRLETFDGVFVHDAIGYATSEAGCARRWRRPICTCDRAAWRCSCRTMSARRSLSTSHHGSDGDDARYATWWAFDPTRRTGTFTVVYTFVLRDPDGTIHASTISTPWDCSHGRYGCGCCATWASSLRESWNPTGEMCSLAGSGGEGSPAGCPPLPICI